MLGVSPAWNLYIPRNGKLLDIYGAKAIHAGKHHAIAFLDSAIQITAMPTRGVLPLLDEEAQQKIADGFQAKLLMYRLMNHAKVRGAQFDVPEFTSQMRIIARALGASIVDLPELQAHMVASLRDQDEQIRVERSTELESIVIEALLFLCHEDQRESAYVGEVTRAVNGILKGRGETLELEARAVGDQLRGLGLFTRRLGSAGRGLLLLDATRRRLHQLARSYDAPSLQDGKIRCQHCAETKVAANKGM